MPAVACTGDCNGDGMVTVNDLVRGVNIALGALHLSDCPAFDLDDNKRVTINEIVMGVGFAVSGCPPTATPTPTATRTQVTGAATPTRTANQPPAVPCAEVYRTYPGYPIHLPINATDSSGALRYTAESLPAGARLYPSTGTLNWIPQKNQLGPFYIPFTVSDAGTPALFTKGLLALKVSPRDLCTRPACDPATGCESTLIPLSQPCCVDTPMVRVAEPLMNCPEGRVLFIGRNIDLEHGFGRLQNCDRLELFNNQQISATARINIEARCVVVGPPRVSTVHARLETKEHVAFDESQDVILTAGANGFGVRLAAEFALVRPGSDFFDFEGSEATLSVTLTDPEGVVLSEQLRLVTTFFPLDDLLDPPDVLPPPTDTCTPGSAG